MTSFAVVILRIGSALCGGLAIIVTLLTVLAGIALISGQLAVTPSFVLSLWVFTAAPLAIAALLLGRAWQYLAADLAISAH